jgi:D-xylose transport system permease protein
MTQKVKNLDNALLASQEPQSTSDFLTAYFRRLRGGDLGPLPIVFGLIIIAIIFQTQNANFLTAKNFVNLVVQMTGITTIAYGVVFILILGEIDLSVGYVSAVSAVAMTMMLRGPLPLYVAFGVSMLATTSVGFLLWRLLQRFKVTSNLRIAITAIFCSIMVLLFTNIIGYFTLAWFFALPIALLAALGIGLIQGFLITTFQLPAFVVTLAGLLAWNGVVLILIGNGGTVILQDPTILAVANTYLSPELGWIVAALIVLGYVGVQYMTYITRQRQGLVNAPLPVLAGQTVLLALLIGIVVYVCNQDRGVPGAGVILGVLLVLLSYLANNTQFGRYAFAIGGNAEAARRAGINVQQIRVIIFMISSLMAGIGGVILASRLRSVDTNAGGGNLVLNSIASAVIGGTSLFGGSGKVSSAVLGALVIASVENGMGLLGLPSGVKFVVTGLVLLVAVIVDSISRRNQKRAGLR